MAEDVSRKPGTAAELVKAEEPAAAPVKPKLVAAKPVATPSADEEKNKVIHIVRRLQDETIRTGALKKRPWVAISLLAGIVAPTIVASLFYLFIAADRFVSEARFAVRSNEAQAIDALGMITGIPGSQTVSNSYIVADYIASRDMVEQLEARLPLRAMYATDAADYFYRLGDDVTQEQLIEYWQNRVDVYYDSTKNTIAVAVQAFRPEDAEKIAREIVDVSRVLVNDLSAQSRRDAVQFAAAEVARAELRVRGARENILEFRIANNQLDPTESASATLGIAAELEGERSKLASQLASVEGYLSDAAPSVQILKSRIAALDGEIARIQSQISQGAPTPESRASGTPAADEPAMASIVGRYQELLLDQEFAEKAYTAAMASLERAHSEANRTQSYLAIYGDPSPAEEAIYPRRWLNILFVVILSAVAWSIGALGFLTVRDHMP